MASFNRRDGDILIGNQKVADHLVEIRKMIGVLPESHGYYNWMSGREYLTLFAKLYGYEKSKLKDRVDEVLTWVGMIEKAHVPIGQYSRGMRQRIGLAKTIIHEPELIFLDEPTLGLDPQGQKDIQNIIQQLNKEKGVTVFITSHLLKDISEICNRVAIVSRGNLIEENSLERLLEKYKGLSANWDSHFRGYLLLFNSIEGGKSPMMRALFYKEMKEHVLIKKRSMDLFCPFDFTKRHGFFFCNL